MSSILFFRNYFDTSAINEQFLMKVMIITAICWLPIHLIKRIGDRISPSEEDKLPKNDKNKNNKGLLPDSWKISLLLV